MDLFGMEREESYMHAHLPWQEQVLWAHQTNTDLTRKIYNNYTTVIHLDGPYRFTNIRKSERPQIHQYITKTLKMTLRVHNMFGNWVEDTQGVYFSCLGSGDCSVLEL